MLQSLSQGVENLGEVLLLPCLSAAAKLGPHPAMLGARVHWSHLQIGQG